MQTERRSDGKRCLLRELVVEVEGTMVTVPADFVTDFSSIPWWGWMLVRWSKVDVAGVVHDRLYATGELPRADADRVWRLVAQAGAHHANFLQAWLGWLGLRLGAWVAWNNHRRASAGRSSAT